MPDNEYKLHRAIAAQGANEERRRILRLLRAEFDGAIADSYAVLSFIESMSALDPNPEADFPPERVWIVLEWVQHDDYEVVGVYRDEAEARAIQAGAPGSVDVQEAELR